MTRYSSAGATGRQLLNLKRKLSAESDPDTVRSLRRKEIRLLLSMGQRVEADSRSKVLVSDYPRWPEAHSIRADVLCRHHDWKEAETCFRRAVELHRESGDMDKAARLAQGPLFRHAEADGRFVACIELAMLPGFPSPVLECRARRNAGESSGCPEGTTEDYPLGALLILERAWRGEEAGVLLETVREWPGSEPEWRWRVLVEGVRIWQDRGRGCRGWKKVLRMTHRPVLDPRFIEEAIVLDRTFRFGEGNGKR